MDKRVGLKKSVFLISFDFEQRWGVFDSIPLQQYKQNLLGEKTVVPAILSLFAGLGIHATWATVGFLFARDKTELQSFVPQILPSYKNAKYSPYPLIKDIGDNEQADPIHYSASLINKILNTPYQEIATHTFSHYYCLEDGQTPKQFQADMEAAAAIAKPYGVNYKSIIFPRNQFNPAYLAILTDCGITAFRGVENHYFYQAKNFREETSPPRRLGRLIDSYINLTGHNTYGYIQQEAGLWNFPSSRFFRPYFPRLKFLERLKLGRIKHGMTYAAKHNHLYHLWWHPHNFGINQKKNLAQLREILGHFIYLQKQFGMISCNMKELTQQLNLN